MKSIDKRITIGERVFYFFNYLFLILCIIVAVFPIIHVVATSFSSSNAIASGKVFLLPVDFSLEAYNSIFKDGNVLLSLKNTVVITLFGTAFNMLFTIMCAYPLSRKR
ncbi:MAG: carbohydrate ABC transporter permease, partial [Firmicutes bacterium]|nr:carbohydrate ABC transporter permease [Bacillota bacterium]